MLCVNVLIASKRFRFFASKSRYCLLSRVIFMIRQNKEEVDMPFLTESDPNKSENLGFLFYIHIFKYTQKYECLYSNRCIKCVKLSLGLSYSNHWVWNMKSFKFLIKKRIRVLHTFISCVLFRGGLRYVLLWDTI